MLNLSKLAAGPGAGRYYLDQVARGREDYYAGEGEAPGEWIGDGAALLGLSGQVEEEGVLRLLRGRHPGTGDPLRELIPDGAVAGFDLTFRAPKSVSILFGIADPELSAAVTAAHDAAVAEALGYLEREACRVRRGRGGAVVMDGAGFVGAAFRHRTSRAGDPLLHTHVVVANVARGPDGRWTALHGQLLFRHAKTAGYLYQAVLRAELAERLPVRWLAVEHGTADLAGVPRRVIEHFSERRAEILEHMAARGERSARAAQIATLETRRRKAQEVPIERLRAEWRARAAEHGLDRTRLQHALTHRATTAEVGVDFQQVSRRLESSVGLTRDATRFTRRDVVQAFAEAARQGGRVHEIEALADAFLQRPTIVWLERDHGDEPTYSTRELLDVERELLDGADSRRNTAVAVAAEATVAAAIRARPSLSDEQRQLVETLSRSSDGVQVVLSPAGTGKTFALGAAVEAWQRSGIPVLGCALSARAACELRDQAGLETTTIASLRRALDGGIELAHGGVLIVDEAGMVGTRDLAALASAAERAHAKLVVVGDDRQLPEIQAGGAFGALAQRLGAIELREVRRQSEHWDRAALTHLREGDVEAFARAYEGRGRLVAAPTHEAARQAMVDDWYAAQAAGGRALMLAHRRADVADLNARARERMRAEGRIGPDVLLVGPRAFAAGDRVAATRNDRRLGVVNGQTGVLDGVRDGVLQLRFDDGRRLAVPERYARDGHLDHGYASTVHRAQGATVDRAFVLGSDELFREWGYTALSRHREAARFYVTAASPFVNEAPAPLEPGEGVAFRVARMLQTSRAQHLASEDAHEQSRRDLAERRRSASDARLAGLQEQRARTPWHRRGRRAKLDRLIIACERERAQWQDAPEPPRAPAPRLRPARDPLARVDRELGRDQGRDLGRGL